MWTDLLSQTHEYGNWDKEYINGIFDAVQPFQFQATDLTRCILIGRFFWGKGGGDWKVQGEYVPKNPFELLRDILSRSQENPGDSKNGMKFVGTLCQAVGHY